MPVTRPSGSKFDTYPRHFLPPERIYTISMEGYRCGEKYEGERNALFEDSVDFRSYDPQLFNHRVKLPVLAEAIRHYGAPEALVTDGGGQFYSAQALQLYEMLGIRKERIEPGEPWQNYAETLLYVTWNYPSC